MLQYSKLHKIFDELNIKVKPDLLKTALTHSSVTFENGDEQNYERLEFLGDSVLKLTMSDILYKKYPDYEEGRMTKIRGILVADSMLAKLGKEINISELIIVGKSEKKDHGQDKESVIACVMEAIFGAVYLSCGLNKVMSLIKYIFKDVIENVDEHLDTYNAKAVLQEYTQGLNKDLPEYKLIEEKGKAHNKTFYYEIFYRGNILANGSGKTKRDAQQDAAKSACEKLGIFKGEKDE
ncbi:ribonuclease III [bacterium]|nr:ribonuclease III [bacterium]